MPFKAPGLAAKGNVQNEKNKQLACLHFAAGVPPYTRGPYATMYLVRPWTIRQYAGFSTAEASNAFYRNNLAAGQKGLSVAFDLPTHRGYDSDHPRVRGDVGKAGVAVDTVEDMKILFDQINLQDISVSMTMNGAVLPIMAFYIVAAEEQGITTQQLIGTIQNDILKEFMVRNTYIYPPEPSMRIVADVIKYAAQYMPKFNPISISGYHMHEAGAGAALELAYTLADGLDYVRAALRTGLHIDDFAPRLSFFWGVGMDFLTEVAKLRAARFLWATLIKPFNPANPLSMALRTHCQTSGWSLTAQEPFNNIVRTTIEAMAAVAGGTQSLHTNALDEALALPTEYSAAIARETQLYLQYETDITKIIDPFGGSAIVEQKTSDLIREATVFLQEVDSLGGMTKAIEQGLPKRRIEEEALRKQGAIESGVLPIIGVNVMQESSEQSFTLLDVDLEAVITKQINRLETVKHGRKPAEVQQALQVLEEVARTGQGNLLEAAVVCARARATLGEISLALEQAFGRYTAIPRTMTGVYANTMQKNEDYQHVVTKAKMFETIFGRRPRILVCKLGQDGHDRGARVVASSFADMGFDVDLGAMFLTPEEAVKQAIENDVHFLGISSLAGGHKTLVPEVLQLLKVRHAEHILVVLGGIIPTHDYEELFQQGVAAIFGPGTILTEAALALLEVMISKNPDHSSR